MEPIANLAQVSPGTGNNMRGKSVQIAWILVLFGVHVFLVQKQAPKLGTELQNGVDFSMCLHFFFMFIVIHRSPCFVFN